MRFEEAAGDLGAGGDKLDKLEARDRLHFLISKDRAVAWPALASVAVAVETHLRIVSTELWAAAAALPAPRFHAADRGCQSGIAVTGTLAQATHVC